MSPDFPNIPSGAELPAVENHWSYQRQKEGLLSRPPRALGNFTKLLVTTLLITWEMCQNLGEEGCTACKKCMYSISYYHCVLELKKNPICNTNWEFNEIFMCFRSGQRFTKIVKQSSKPMIVGSPFSLTCTSFPLTVPLSAHQCDVLFSLRIPTGAPISQNFKVFYWNFFLEFPLLSFSGPLLSFNGFWLGIVG